MKTYHWTADSFADEQDFHRYIKRHFARGSAYGANLDALYDVLTSVRDITLIISRGWDKNLGRRADKIRQVILDAADENSGLTIISDRAAAVDASDISVQSADPAESAIYYGGPILTMDDLCPEATAIYVENGIIAEVRTDDDGCDALRAAYPDARLIDLQGRTMMPGLIDSHSHMTALSYRHLPVNCPPSPPDADQVMRSLKETCHYYAQQGYTTVQDGCTGETEYEMLSYASSHGLLCTDVISYLTPEAAEKYLPVQDPADNLYRNHYRLAGCKLFLDGSLQDKTAWLTESYYMVPEGENPDYRGFPAMSDEAVQDVMDTCLANHWQINVHVNGDAAVDQLIRCYSRALRLADGTCPDLRPVAIHCQTVREDQLLHMKQIGMLPSFFEDHVYYWGNYHRDIVLGPKRASHINPAASAHNDGLTFTLHQDCPVVEPRPFLSLHTAVNRLTKEGDVLGEDQKIPVLEALKALTLYGAYQIFEEKSKGSITAGKIADLIILDRNPLTADPLTLKDIRVLQTIKEGKELL